MEAVHRYPDIHVHLTLFHATIAAGTPKRLEHNDLRWVTTEELGNFPFCPADKEIIERLQQA